MDEVLIYVYNLIRDEPIPPAVLLRTELLIRPEILTRKPWSQGYFQNLRRCELSPEDAFPRHCFEFGGRYWDEFSRPVASRFDPCGTAGVGNVSTLDDAISRALGIPLAAG
jgi:hypothetical protein